MRINHLCQLKKDNFFQFGTDHLTFRDWCQICFAYNQGQNYPKIKLKNNLWFFLIKLPFVLGFFWRGGGEVIIIIFLHLPCQII